MSTPSGLLRWGQGGRYSGWDDRVVITALSGRRTGVVVPVRMAAAPGLAITVEAEWLAVAPCGDGTSAVITSPVAVQVGVAPGGDVERTDELVAEIADPESATWTLAVQPEGWSGGGLVLGWVGVPPGADSAADMNLIPREQDFSTGGAIPGPIGPPGPQGQPGTSTIIVGTFRTRTPDELPPDGFLPAGWDGPGNPANDVQMDLGWSLIYAADGTMWTYVTEAGMGGPWLSPGVVTGPPGERGPEGPPGPQGPAGGLPLDQWHDMRAGLINGATYPGGGELVPQYRFNADRTMVVVVGSVNPPSPAINTNFFIFPPAYRPAGIVGWAASPNLTANPPNSPRFYVGTDGGIQIAGGWSGPCRFSGEFCCRGNPDVVPLIAPADDIPPLPA